MIGYVVTNNNDAFMCSVDESNHEFTKIDNNEHIDVHESIEKAFESVIKYLTIKKVFKI